MDKTQLHIDRCYLIVDYYEEKYGKIPFVKRLRDSINDDVKKAGPKKMVGIDHELTSMIVELPQHQQNELRERLKQLNIEGLPYENLAIKAAKKALLTDEILTLREAELIYQHLNDCPGDFKEDQRQQLEQMLHSFSGPEEE